MRPYFSPFGMPLPWPDPDRNIPDSGGVPVNWPTFDRGALRGMPLPRDFVICAYCDATLRHDSRGRCTNCAAPAWPPPSQEARAAAHGITRTKGMDL